uniref:Uncharacterized protein n=1 Tax=Rhodosorus marinus TaxID=101924 RepID=A0A7S0BV65_9RHOD
MVQAISLPESQSNQIYSACLRSCGEDEHAHGVKRMSKATRISKLMKFLPETSSSEHYSLDYCGIATTIIFEALVIFNDDNVTLGSIWSSDCKVRPDSINFIVDGAIAVIEKIRHFKSNKVSLSCAGTA